MAEPTENTYVITVVLRGVRKRDALAAASDIRAAVEWRTAPHTEILVAHLKDEA